MHLMAIILVVISAFLHASWNIVGKSNQASVQSFFFMSALLMALLLSPFLCWFYYQAGAQSFSPLFWSLLMTSAFFQIIYLMGLGLAYKKMDIGIVYPLARALPVLLVGILYSLMGNVVTALQWLGFIFIMLGCLLVPLTRFKQFSWRAYANTSILWAILAAVGTTGYSMVDTRALAELSTQLAATHPPQLIALFYLGAQFWATALPFSVFFIIRGQHHEFIQAWKIKKMAFVAGLMMAITYGLVLNAMMLTDNISLIVALRQISIVFVLILSVACLHEKLFLSRFVGCVFVIIGLIISL